MSAANETLVDNASLQALQDRTDIADVLYRYSSSVDSFDREGARSALADDIWAQYGNAEPVMGGDALADWIAQATATVIWQHHLLNVYHVKVEGDRASTLSYLTSYQVFKENPDAAIILVARYHDELRRTPAGWRIRKRIMELLWGESKPDDGYLATLGGRGPKIWQRG
ncbi:MAG: nuclear transport factor 2 family protein [Solirubrobacteraceae bacterium]